MKGTSRRFDSFERSQQSSDHKSTTDTSVDTATSLPPVGSPKKRHLLEIELVKHKVKLENMEETMRHKDEELENALGHCRVSAHSVDENSWFRALFAL